VSDRLHRLADVPPPNSPSPIEAFAEQVVALPDGRPRLAVRTAAGSGRAFLLVHGLASNARLWDGVGRQLAVAGHRVVAVDQRGHGRSQAPTTGYDTDTCADDLAALLAVLGLVGDAAPVVAGQSWGGNVVLSLAARHPGSVAALACVDGGWIRLHDRFATFEDCWAALAPPRFDGLRYDDVAGRIAGMHPDWPSEGVDGSLANLVRTPGGGVRARLARAHHRDIVRSLYEGDPHAWYPLVDVPVLLVPATGPQAAADDDPRPAGTRDAVRQALAELPDGEVRWYPGADHDLHAQHPAELAADLLTLAARADAARTEVAS
jgi:pimeloyl-ACP methyl ester carboxylesterase